MSLSDLRFEFCDCGIVRYGNGTFLRAKGPGGELADFVKRFRVGCRLARARGCELQ